MRYRLFQTRKASAYLARNSIASYKADLTWRYNSTALFYHRDFGARQDLCISILVGMHNCTLAVGVLDSGLVLGRLTLIEQVPYLCCVQKTS